jgi:hypothetical protein
LALDDLRHLAYGGRSRRLWPTISLTLAASAASIMSWHSSTVIAMGFSQKMCLPARAAIKAMGQCKLLGVNSATARACDWAKHSS